MRWSWTEAAAGRDAAKALPHGWGQTRVADISWIVNGAPYDSKHFGDLGEPLLRIRDLAAQQVETRYDGPELTGYRVTGDSLLVGMDGDFNVGRWILEEPALLNQRVLAIEADPLWSKWIEYCLPPALKVINDLTYATTVKHLSSVDVAKIRIPSPPRELLRAIADYLDHETAEIDALTKDLISLQELTSEKLEAEREYLLGLSEPGLIWTRLKFLSGVTVGIVVNPSAWYVESGVPALRGTNVKPERMVLSDLIKISKEGHAFHRKSALSAGDVVIVRTGQAGAAATVPKSLDGSNAIDLLIAKPGPSLSGNYLAAYINSSRARHQFQAGTVGAIQGHFNVEDLKNLEIPVMSLCEQTARVNSWAAERKKAHALVEAISSAVQLTRERRAALITATVTGQIDVTARNKPAAEQLEDDIAQGLHREN